MKNEQASRAPWRGDASIVIVLAALWLTGAGCAGKNGARAAYHDPYPLPADTMTVPVEEIGQHGGRFVIAQTNDPKTFNVIMSNEQSSNDIVARMFFGLTEYDNAAQVSYPAIAKSWESSPDGLTWTWHLRHGARFSDGHPITAEDVLFSFEVTYDDSLHPSVQDLLQIDGKRFEVSAPDSYTVVTRIAETHVLVPAVVGSLKIMPKHVLEAAFRAKKFASAYNLSTPPESIVTSGPWRLAQYVPGQRVVLKRNPYWLGVDAKGQRLPYLDELVYMIVPDQNTAALKFQAGELDALDNVKPEDYKTYTDRAKTGDFTLHELGPSLTSNFFWFNLNRVRSPRPGKRVGDPYVDRVKHAWFSNPDFRRAVSMAIDREAIIRGPQFGEGVKNWSLFTPGSKRWGTPDLVGYDYNPKESKRLLAGLGLKDRNGDGFLDDAAGHTVGFTLQTNSDNAVRVAMSTFIKDDLAKVGIKCTPVPLDFTTLVNHLREDFQYEAILLGLGSSVPSDPGMAANFCLSSGLTHYWNVKQPKPETRGEAEIDSLYPLQISTFDEAQRRRLWEEIVKRVNDQCWTIWLPSQRLRLPVRNRFGNIHPVLIPHRILWNIDRVFVKAHGQRA